MSDLGLGEKQRLFSKLLGDLLVWIYETPGWGVTLADGAIDTPRKFRGEDGRVFEAPDGHHMKGSLHYYRLAQDLNLFIEGAWITDGGHPAWAAIGQRWEGMHPLCAWGGRFSDANHFSIQHDGKK